MIGSDFMVLSYGSTQESDSSVLTNLPKIWLEKLQEGKKSTQQIESEMLEGVTETIKDIQAKAEEKAAEEAKDAKNEEAVAVSVGGSTVETSSDVPETPETSTVEVKA